MCEHGDTTIRWIAARPVELDRCIAGLVETLNKAGYRTVASCCGHGNRPGSIAFANGQELIVARNYDEARQIDAMFPDIHGNRSGAGVKEAG